ncbi:MAG: glutamate-5-semialdehyde dehydrogenase [Planctomycetota bacterium]|nr:MAG: glutamate-5-semialdehyde dehydrogenase [Planctomycetota bacterium]
MEGLGLSYLAGYCLDVARRARAASRSLVRVGGATKNAWLKRSAGLLRARTADIIAANAQDLAAAPGFGLTAAAIDRLRLDERGVEAVATALEEIAAQGDPIGEVIESTVRPNGLEIQKVRVPLGVVFFIYESRPNVTADAAALCVKSGNAVILRGGKEAAHSSRAIVDVLGEAARECGIPDDAVQLVSTPDREAVGEFLRLSEYIDVAIPRGGDGLIRRVTAEAKMPVIKHFDGNCHVYVDRAADLDMAERVLVNAKCQRLGVCNAAESLLVHADVAETFLPRAASALVERGIEIRGDATTRRIVPTAFAATEQDWGMEYLGPVISCRVVGSLDEAIAHINRYGSKHTDAILTNDLAAARRFANEVDTAAVMINASTRFNDGGQFGLGAEIGISTDKFHARGPCGAKELTTYKWIVYGTGQVRD